VTTSLERRTKSLHAEIADIKKDLHEEFNIRIQGTQVKMETTLHGLDTRLAEVEARVECGPCWRM
jgi:hypothetical protein